MMVNCIVTASFLTFPWEVMFYALSVCLIYSVVTRSFGGFHVLEMYLWPVVVDMNSSADFYLEPIKDKGIWDAFKEIFRSHDEAEPKRSTLANDSYIRAIRLKKGL